MLLQQAERIRDWNVRVIHSLPPIPKHIEGKEPKTTEYLRGRKRVFTDFAIAAEKIAETICRSGYIMIFQLEMEVRRLVSLTLHEVQELAEFLSDLIEKNPEVKSNFIALLNTLEEIGKEIEESEIIIGCDRD